MTADRAGGGEDGRAPVARPVCARPEPSGPARSHARPEPVPHQQRQPPVTALSYTSLQQHTACGYRFYLERVLGLPATDDTQTATPRPRRDTDPDPRTRGRLVHALLERLDFVDPTPPDKEAVMAEANRAGTRLTDAAAHEIAQLIDGFLASDLRKRLAAISHLRTEQPFSLRLRTGEGEGEIPLVGVFDLIARDRAKALVVDWKSDRLDPAADPATLAAQDYGLQRAAYALAALRDGAQQVEVVHCFLERPHEPATATYAQQDLPELTATLAAHADAVIRREFAVAPDPRPRICDGCPGRGSLCSWPLERTLDVPEGRLF
jgi:ATP-dependent helicase/nuclease subunit A